MVRKRSLFMVGGWVGLGWGESYMQFLIVLKTNYVQFYFGEDIVSWDYFFLHIFLRGGGAEEGGGGIIFPCLANVEFTMYFNYLQGSVTVVQIFIPPHPPHRHTRAHTHTLRQYLRA